MYSLNPRLSVRQHAANFGCIRIARNDSLTQFSFSPRRFLRQDMPGERMVAFDLAAGSNFEALGRASMCF